MANLNATAHVPPQRRQKQAATFDTRLLDRLECTAYLYRYWHSDKPFDLPETYIEQQRDASRRALREAAQDVADALRGETGA